MKKPKVSLVNFSPDAIETMCWARRVMHSEVPDSLEEFKANPEKWLGMSIDEYVEKVLLLDGMPGFLEHVNLTFKLENVSRALQQQLTRHRIGFSFNIQSLRCVNVPNFADEYHYCNPCTPNSNEAEKYHNSMLKIQKLYREALADGIPTQDARGLLPMNLYSTITFSCSLRAFIGMINKRLCLKTQGEFREVANLMVTEVLKKIDPRLKKWIGPPCQVQNYCMMKGECEQQYQDGQMTGKQNTDYVCPLYIKYFK